MKTGKRNVATWSLPDRSTQEALKAAICERFRIRREEGTSEERTYFDTFDWRLYRKGLLLHRNRHGWTLSGLETGEPVGFFADSPEQSRRFRSDFSQTPLAPYMDRLLGLRALLPLFQETIVRETFRILNRDEKTVALAILEERTVQDEVRLLVTLQNIRGYRKKFKALHQLLEEFALDEAIGPAEAFHRGARLGGREPGAYSSALQVTLDPDLSAMQAAKNIFLQLLETMRANEAGIRDDLDTEFLHDFRVAVRRTRSGLALFKEVLPEDIREHFRNEFSFLGRVTGPVRDLDVYLLLAEQGYRNRLPEYLQGGLEDFFSRLHQTRKQEFARLIRTMDSPRYKSILSDWEDVLQADDRSWSGCSDMPVIDLAIGTIRKWHRRIIEDGKEIKDDSPDEALHRLRIRCKKLRYGLEFFASLFPAGKMRRIRKQLKHLQDNLGAFNDLAVQQNMLREHLERLRPGVRKNLYQAAALGGLLTSLHREQEAVRSGFAASFARFSGKKTSGLFRELFY